MTAWNGYFAPAGTQSPSSSDCRRQSPRSREPESSREWQKLSLEPVGNAPEEVADIIRRELPIYEAAVTRGLAPQLTRGQKSERGAVT
jgi:hypothetical protein